MERRDAVVDYMRKLATVLWRAGEDITYTIVPDVHPDETSGMNRLRIVKGRLYQGIPYSYAGSTDDAFMAYASEKEGQIPVITGLTWQNMSGRYANGARIGNDCSASVILSWSQIGASVEMTNTRYMTPLKGFLRVGEYASNDADNTDSLNTCNANGPDVMGEAYAKLQKADAVVNRSAAAGHTMLVTGVYVVRNPDGSVDMLGSKITVIEQTRRYLLNDLHFYSEKLGENVYLTFGIDVEYSFCDLMKEGYLPITCRELIDPAPVDAPRFADSLTEHNAQSILKGRISCNWMIDRVTVKIENEAGVVQQAYTHASRGSNRELDLAYFKEGQPFSIVGSVTPETLTTGKYHCLVICRLTSGAEYRVRDFFFDV